jgi:TPR repeat protein
MAEGCYKLGALYFEGRGVPVDPPRAAQLMEQACEANDMEGCFVLGQMYDQGAGVTQDQGRARTLFKRACDGGVSKACGR